jgi:chemotaxis protein CheX
MSRRFPSPELTRSVDDTVEEVFARMLRTPMVRCGPHEGDEETIEASIRMMSEPQAVCRLEISARAGDRLTDAMLGSEADWDAEMIEDAVGELCNMITGGVKRRSGWWQGGCRISLPTIARRAATAPAGDGMRRAYRFGDVWVVVTVEME